MMEGGMRWVSDFGSNVTREHMIEGAYTCAEGTVINRIMGVVQSHHVGLVRAGVRIKIMERTDLRVKWSIEDARGVVVLELGAWCFSGSWILDLGSCL